MDQQICGVWIICELESVCADVDSSSFGRKASTVTHEEKKCLEMVEALEVVLVINVRCPEWRQVT